MNELAQAKGANVAGLRITADVYGLKPRRDRPLLSRGRLCPPPRPDGGPAHRPRPRSSRREARTGRKRRARRRLHGAPLAFRPREARGAREAGGAHRARDPSAVFRLLRRRLPVHARRHRGVSVIDEREYARLLGYPPGRALEGEVRRLADEAIHWYANNGAPRATFCSAEGGVAAGFTAGAEVDDRVAELWQEGRVDEAYFLDRLAAAVVEALAAETGRELGAVHRSPGTTGYPIEEQWTLMRALEPLAPAIELLPSGALRPKHSLVALYVPGDATSVSCGRCDLRGCDFRRVA